MTKHYDAIIIGSGQGTHALIGKLTGEGWQVAIVEKDALGGSCVNYGCTPTKTLVASARAAHMARRGADFGVLTGEIAIDWQRVKERVNNRRGESREGLEGWFESIDNLDVYMGEGRFVESHTVEVNGQQISADKIFISTGTRANIPPIEGIHDVPFLTNKEMFELDEIPQHLIVIGGSYIGLEFAQAFRRFGSKVTLIEYSGQLANREDQDVSEGILEIMENEGIDVFLNSKCISVRRDGDAIVATMDCEHPEDEVRGSHVLLATGRTPNSDIGLDTAGVEVNERGYIVVDQHLRTNVEGVYALGDVNGQGAFTHTSYNDFQIVENLLFGDGSRTLEDRYTIYGLFIDPPLGRVGLTETQARQQGYDVRVASKPMSHIGRALEKDETQGFMKFIVDAKTQRFLGASILGVGGDEIVSSVAQVMYADAPYTVYRDAVLPHPTISELIPTTLEEIEIEAPETA